MACCEDGHIDELTLEKNKEIEEQISKAKKEGAPIRLLLLGAGESGKSTIAKQMKILHMNGYTPEERAAFTLAIHANVYQSMRALVNAATKTLGLTVKAASAEVLQKFDSPIFDEKITPEFGKEMAAMWKDASIQKGFERRNEFQLNDSCKYYMDELARVTSADFVPTEQDVLRSRVQTTGIIETNFQVEKTKFVLVDVGGQRSERKKWIHCFEDVTGVLFCVGLSEFDQVLYEDNKTNRMLEALKLFHEICQSKWFSESAMILFLNKTDLFAEKLASGKSIRTAFPDYAGSNNYQDATKFIKAKFCDVTNPLTDKPRDIYPHLTCATDTNNVRVVFEAVKTFLLSSAIASVGLM